VRLATNVARSLGCDTELLLVKTAGPPPGVVLPDEFPVAPTTNDSNMDVEGEKLFSKITTTTTATTAVKPVENEVRFWRICTFCLRSTEHCETSQLAQ